MTTGKNKEQFEKWLKKQPYYKMYYYNDIQSFEMQIGVYLAYYDSLGYSLDVFQEFDYELGEHDSFCCEAHKGHKPIFDVDNMKTRNEAYKEAFKKANEIINAK